MKGKRNRKWHGRRGQGILEYILLITAVIVALLAFFGKGGVFERSYNDVISQQGDDVGGMARRIFF